MHLKSWLSNLGLAIVALIAIGIVAGVHVQTQTPFIVFGSSSGASQPIKSTSNALWVSINATAMTGNIITTTSNGVIGTGVDGVFAISARSRWSSNADKLVQFLDSASATGEEFNFGTPTLGTCTGGAIVSGSHNFAGSYTGNTSSSCAVNFGTPNWTNAPTCIAASRASATFPHVTAVSGASVTFTGGVSGEQIDFICKGRIGT